jgi:hypothetical protein
MHTSRRQTKRQKEEWTINPDVYADRECDIPFWNPWGFYCNWTPSWGPELLLSSSFRCVAVHAHGHSPLTLPLSPQHLRLQTDLHKNKTFSSHVRQLCFTYSNPGPKQETPKQTDEWSRVCMLQIKPFEDVAGNVDEKEKQSYESTTCTSLFHKQFYRT